MNPEPLSKKELMDLEEILETERELRQIQESTRTTFAAFQPIHEYLRSKSRFYYHWHLKEGHRVVHATILVSYLFLIAFFVSSQLGFISIGKAASNIAKLLNYQAKLVDSNGQPVADGNYNIKFTIYDAPTGGNCVYTARGGCPTLGGAPQPRSVPVTDGVLTVVLGDTANGDNPITLDFTTDSFYLGVTVGDDSEMTPRRRIGASGYAFNADTVDGYHAGTGPNQVLALDANGNINIAGSASLGGSLTVTGAMSGGSLTATGTTVLNSSLTVAGASNLNGNVTLGDSAADTLTINAAPTFAANTTFNGNLTANGNLTFGDASTDLININGRINSHLIPATNNTQDLGTAALRWRSGYFGTGLTVGGTVEMTGFKLTTAPTAGYVLVSDADGVGTWQPVPNVSGWADDGAVVRLTTITDSVGIGTTNPGGKLEVLNNSTNVATNNVKVAVINTTGATFNTTAAGLTNYAGYFTNTATRSAGANDLTNVALYLSASGAQNNYGLIVENGNVGIGTASPSAKLEILDGSIDNYVNGISFGANSSYKHKITAHFDGPNPVNSSMQFKVANNNTGGNVGVMTLRGSGNVGIGTTAPQNRLHLGNDFPTNIGDSTAKKLALYNSATGSNFAGLGISGNNGAAGTTLEFHVDSQPSDLPLMVLKDISDVASVGIGTTNPGNTLHVNGGIRVATLDAAAATAVCRDGDGDLSTCVSSRFYKKDISYLTDGDYTNVLNDIANTNLARYRMYYEPVTRPPHIGLIAEESPAQLQFIDENTHTNVDWFSMWAYSWAGIKELNKKISPLVDSATSVDSLGNLTVRQAATFDGTLLVKNTATFEKDIIVKGLILGSEFTRGSIVLAANQNSAAVNFSVPASMAPVSIIASADYNTNVWITNVSQNGFVLNVGVPSSQNQTIYWQAQY